MKKLFILLDQFENYVIRKVEKIYRFIVRKKYTSSKVVDRIIYKKIISADIIDIIRRKGSKYIPENIRNRQEVKAIVIARHNEKMLELGIYLDNDLKLHDYEPKNKLMINSPSSIIN